MNENKAQPTVRVWIAIVIFILMGAIAGNTEGMYMGLFLDNTVFAFLLFLLYGYNNIV